MRIVVAVATLGLTLVATACQSGQADHSGPQAKAVPTSPDVVADSVLRRVEDPSLVCMVNDQVMGRPQIPITVEGRTYYGCCENCKKRLAEDEGARLAKDPVTGAMVDKSAAVIGQDPSGRVFYFASEDSLRAFKSL